MFSFNFLNPPRGLRILMYHQIGGRAPSPLSVSFEQFKKQIFWLKEHYSFIDAKDVTAAVAGSTTLGPRSVLITFDDAYKNLVNEALPFLIEHQIRPLIFVPTKFVAKSSEWDQPSMPIMTWQELKKWQSHGVDLASHSHSHQNYTLLSLDEIKSDLIKSKLTFEDHSVQLFPALAYPYGKFCKQAPTQAQWILLLQELGFQWAVRIGNRVNTNLGSPFFLQRMDIQGQYSFRQFQRRIHWGRWF